jgi:hypothetical protein
LKAYRVSSVNPTASQNKFYPRHLNRADEAVDEAADEVERLTQKLIDIFSQ